MPETEPRELPREWRDHNSEEAARSARSDDETAGRPEENWRGYPLHILNLVLDS